MLQVFTPQFGNASFMHPCSAQTGKKYFVECQHCSTLLSNKCATLARLVRLAGLADWVENCTGFDLIRIAQETGYFGVHILCVF